MWQASGTTQCGECEMAFVSRPWLPGSVCVEREGERRGREGRRERRKAEGDEEERRRKKRGRGVVKREKTGVRRERNLRD